MKILFQSISATYAKQAYERSLQSGGNPSVVHQNYHPSSSPHRMLLHSTQTGGQTNAPYNGYPSEQMQYLQQNCGTSYNTTSPSTSVTLHYPTLPSQQTPLSTPASLTSYPNLVSSGVHVASEVKFSN